MPAFQRPLDPASVTIATVSAELPDRRGDSGLARFARYPLLPIRFLVATPSTGPTLSLSWPVTGAARLVDLPPDVAAALGVAELIEVSPLPFTIADVVRALGPPGVPTFYVGIEDAAAPGQDSVVRTDDAPLAVSRAVIGCVFQDRMTLEPWAWIDLIGDALEAAAPADAAGWRTLAALFDGRRTVEVRDAAGRPAAGETFDLRFLDAANAVVRQATLATDAAGSLGPQALPRAGEARAEITWRAPPLPDDETIPVLALYEVSLARPDDDATRAYPGEPALAIPAGARGAHLQVLDLARWYARVVTSPNSPPGTPWPVRYRPRSRVEPLVDGLPTYTRLVEDIRLASGIHMGGWMFGEFPMRPYDPETSLLRFMESKGREHFRLLVSRTFQPVEGVLDGLGTEALIALFVAMIAAEPFMATEILGESSDTGLLVWFAAAGLALTAAALANPDEPLQTFLRNKGEFTTEEVRRKLYDVSEGKPHCAFPAAHPVSMADNPIAHDFDLPGTDLTLSGVQERWGTYHQKFQVLAIPAGDDAFRYVAYLGGIDINPNRVDAPGHHAARPRPADSTALPVPGPYHDVHCRVTGPAVLDVIGIFHERYAHALVQPVGIEPDPHYVIPAEPPPPAFAPPTSVPPAAGQHLVQIAQTSFGPGPGRTGFPWAPEGDAPIRAAFERAIRNAQEYIYIEEQYFTLDDGLIATLRAAADHCRRLVIVVPSSTLDQVFGDQRRHATYERLSGATGGPGGWGDRMVVGTPFRRSWLPHAERHAAKGRASLTDAVTTATASKIYVGPPTRVPTGTPYFFWVAGELMYATKAKKVTSPGGRPSVELEVLRGSFQGTQTPWCPHPRAHAAGAPVTFSSPYPIFVHAKLLMVDDVFVAIGSCNWNRRGFYHDGELDAFAIPDRLRAAPENPALLLRTALWAEQLGLPPAMGRSLLADPVEAFELFRRSRYAGNRFVDFREFMAPRGDLTALAEHDLVKLLPDSFRVTLLATLNAFVMTQVKNLWNTNSDPTTSLDPNPVEGPELA